MFGAFGSDRAWQVHDDGEFAQRLAHGVIVSGGVVATEGANDARKASGTDLHIAQDRERVREVIPRAGGVAGLVGVAQHGAGGTAKAVEFDNAHG